VLCTTELQQVPHNVASRALTLQMEPLGHTDVQRCLERAVAGEGLQVERGVLEAIAQNCDGSVRDAFMILERVHLMSEGEIKVAILESETWYRAAAGVEDFVRGLAHGKKPLYQRGYGGLVSRLDYLVLLRESVRRLSLYHMEKNKRPGRVLDGLWDAYLRLKAGGDPELVVTSLWASVRGEGNGL